MDSPKNGEKNSLKLSDDASQAISFKSFSEVIPLLTALKIERAGRVKKS